LFEGLAVVFVLLTDFSIVENYTPRPSQTKSDIDIEDHNLMKIDDITYWKLIKNKGAFFSYMALGIGMFCECFFASFLTLELETYGVKESVMGYYIAVLSVSYFFGALTSPLIFEKVPRKLQYVISILFSGLSVGFMGPSRYLGLPDRSLNLIMLGMAVLGFIQAPCFVNCIPEVIESLQIEYKIIENYDPELDEVLNDKVAGLYGIVYSVSALFSPIVGGILYDHYHYKNTIDLSMLYLLIVSLIYFVFNCGFKIFEKQKAFDSQLKNLSILIDMGGGLF
jgi:MFS family permease